MVTLEYEEISKPAKIKAFTDLPDCLNNGSPRMYADDTNVSFQSGNLNELKEMMTSDLSRLNTWLKANRLSLNIAKTEYMVIAWHRLAAQDVDRISVHVDNTVIKRVQQTNSLGFTIDDSLMWKNHINAICKKISSGIGALKRVRQFICKDTAEKYIIA